MSPAHPLPTYVDGGHPMKNWLKNAGSFMLPHLLSWVTGAVGLPIVLLARTLVLRLLERFQVNVWAWGAIDKFSFLLFGIVWFVSIIVCEHRYEQALTKGALWPTFRRALGIHLAVLAAIALAIWLV